ncbi:MAG: prepilin-type N-terminal cleavage/methylation domain-containing protein [Planctomycetota bacterium]
MGNRSAKPGALTRPTRPSGRRGAFTLLEVLVVIVIIAILAGICFGVIQAIRARAMRGGTRAEIDALSSALEVYRLQLGSYPSDDITRVGGSPANGPSEVLVYYLHRRLPKGANRYGPYMKFKAAKLVDSDGDGFPEYCDPYGNPYVYAENASDRPPGGVNPGSFDIVSRGPDGVLGGTISPATGYVPATSPAGKAQEKDNITNWGR